MRKELLEIQPQELKFVYELKKQCSCSIQLVSNSDQYVAFKVKTTSPKKYCVRPNAGVLKPKATCDFTVTMQAQRVALSEMQCKDKFLIQSTVVPFGAVEEDITSDMFSKDSGKYIEEKKLKVVLISPPDSPVLLPINGMSKQDPSYETSMQKDEASSGVENIPPSDKLAKDDGFKSTEETDELRTAKDAESRPNKDTEDLKLGKNVMDLKLVKDFEELKSKKNAWEAKLSEVAKDDWFKSTEDTAELKTANNVESRPNKDTEDLKLAKNVIDLKVANDFEELKSKKNAMESKLSEAELTIKKLTEERSLVAREKEMLKQELALSRQKSGVRKVQVGFPFLFVCMVALLSVAVGYLMHP